MNLCSCPTLSFPFSRSRDAIPDPSLIRTKRVQRPARNQGIRLEPAFPEQSQSNAEHYYDNPNNQGGEPGRQDIAETDDRRRHQCEPTAEGDDPACGKRTHTHANPSQFLIELRLEEGEFLADQGARFAGKIREQSGNRAT